MEIKNNKVEVPNGIGLNDKDCLNYLLNNLKEMNKNYIVAITEASNEFLYKRYKEMLEMYSELQREVFEMMFRKGWYVLKSASKEEIKSKHQTLNTELNDMEA